MFTVQGSTAMQRPTSYRSIIAGELFASRQPLELRTVLGSCIAACLYDPEAKVGGMNHFMLPGDSDSQGVTARYGTHAMELLINAIMKQGGERYRIQAKIFGGGEVLDFTASGLNIGQKNRKFIEEFLEAERIPTVGRMLGGKKPLRVHFHTHTGRAFAKTVDREAERAVKQAESEYLRRCRTARPVATTCNVELF